MTKEQRKYWLNRGCINWIINWKSGLDCFGGSVIGLKQS